MSNGPVEQCNYLVKVSELTKEARKKMPKLFNLLLCATTNISYVSHYRAQLSSQFSLAHQALP